MLRSSVVLTCALSVLACGGDRSSPPAPAATAAAPPATPPAGPTAGPPPLSSRGTPLATEPLPDARSAAGLDFALPAGWQQQQPSNTMRIAQAVIPGPGGPGEIAVFFFGPGGGGGTEANLERWLGQIDASAEPRREVFESNGLRITWVDVPGTLKPSQMGMGPATEQPGSRLFGAVVEGPGGPWFFKATGPDATLSAERGRFVELLKNVKARG